jgi:hypothetical protein
MIRFGSLLARGYILSHRLNISHSRIVDGPSSKYKPGSHSHIDIMDPLYHATSIHYVKTLNRSHIICDGPLRSVTWTPICNGCCLALVTRKRGRLNPDLATTTPVTNENMYSL